ncbi:MAG: hypothetical protein ACYTBY_10985 [Planctomycetota bacterium]
MTSKKSQLTTEERTAYLNAAGEAKLRKYTRRFDWESEIANIRFWPIAVRNVGDFLVIWASAMGESRHTGER